MPSSLVADPKAAPTRIRVLTYGPEAYEDLQPGSVDDIATLRGRYPVLWLDVDGLGNAALVRSVGKLFGLHPLALEDVLNTHQRAKVEDYNDHLFIVARMVWLNERLESEQISLFLGSDFLVTFQERPGDCLDPVRERITGSRGHLRSVGHDFLAYTILDAILDAFFPVLEQLGDRLDRLDEEVSLDRAHHALAGIHEIRADLLLFRRAIWPHRDALNALARGDSKLISSESRLYLRDCYDHTIQLVDLTETYRDMAGGLSDLYLSMLSHRMNETMKVLTVIATIFIPLSFVTGIYGMNFNPHVSPWNMPELNWYFGYPFALGLMAAIAAGLLWFFWRKDWL